MLFDRNNLKFAGLIAGVVMPLAAFGQNLVIDGDFQTAVDDSLTTTSGGTTDLYDSSGDLLFSTEYMYQSVSDIQTGYTYTTQGNYGHGLAQEGSAGVWDDPQTAHNLWYAISNNPLGNEELLVNGSSNTSSAVWEGVLSSGLQAGKEYQLSVDLTAIYPSSPAVVSFSVGGQTVDFDLTGTTVGIWHTYTADFIATGSTASVVDLNPEPSGNDFAMDNVKIQAVPEPFTMCLAATGLGLAYRRRTTARRAVA